MDAPMKDLKTRQIEALEKSIAHWKQNATQYLVTKVEISSKACECCIQFYNETDLPSCHNCPIYQFTGERNCDNTPYDTVMHIKGKLLCENTMMNRVKEVTPELNKAIRKEVDFLEALKKELENDNAL
jgi:hypothetical protein